MRMAERLANFERSVAAINAQMICLTPLVRKYLLLHKNVRLCGGPWDEPITLNLRIADWPRQYKFCQETFGNRLLGMNLNWIRSTK